MDARPPPDAPPQPPPAALRHGIAFVLLFYGFAKIMGSQFTILDSELDKPMREVSGFWLTWYYFGYSPVYGNLVALVQVARLFSGACVLAADTLRLSGRMAGYAEPVTLRLTRVR